ncbi:caprin homolog isoform X2 [Daktulosphaira vitifoliae]|uniref:caprin homolog isoform X2 n=1 Tax=Daktulosphaira vitifoliae TaxID=58002 RepID=UPI0021AAA91C|nr:caprin homolog isoform X2 [Daktulosphaira vitifoliae]
MQVATLFRESATLLGAAMEPGSSSDGSSAIKQPNSYNNCDINIGQQSQNQQTSVKQESTCADDGYETSGGGNDAEQAAAKHSAAVAVAAQQHHNNMMNQIPQMHHHHQQHMNTHMHPHHHSHDHHHHQMNNIQPHQIKYEMPDDPYSFVDEEMQHHGQQQNIQYTDEIMLQHMPKKRGRKKKFKPDDQMGLQCLNPDQAFGIMQHMMPKDKSLTNPSKVYKERKKHDRFNGMPEEEVSKRTLPDHLTNNLDIVIIGINPGLFAAYKGHHYAGPGNHFWKCLYLSGLTPEPMTADDDYKLLQNGIGFTNMVERATKGSADLTRKEIKEGSQILLEKLQRFKPKIAVFNGKLIFEVFSGKKDFTFGRQPELVDGTNTYMWVMPSSSARCAQLPRAADKVPFYAALKKFRDYLNGLVSEIDDSEVVFSFTKLKNYYEPEIKDEPKDEVPSVYFNNYNTLVDSQDTLENMSDIKEEPLVVQKKKRGRPKKIKNKDGLPEEVKVKRPKPQIIEDREGVPKKKRGRPKKIKPDSNQLLPTNNIAPPVLPCEHSNPSTQLSNCFSPPIQSPMNLSQLYGGNNVINNIYNNQSSSHSPVSNGGSVNNNTTYHRSPIQSQQHRYSQSPQAPSFTHSDLSSEISAAISSEHNLGSRSPASPNLGPPDFEPPTSLLAEDNSPHSSQHSSIVTKEEIINSSIDQHSRPQQMDCHFANPVQQKTNQKLEMHHYPSSHGYEEYSTTVDSVTGSPAYPPVESPYPQTSSGYSQQLQQKLTNNQDLTAKSLSGLESLVEQIPSMNDNDVQHGVHLHHHHHQYIDETNTGYMTNDYSCSPTMNYSYSSPTPCAPQQNMNNFSVSSLTNGNNHHQHSPMSQSSTFSVSNLASSNYPPPSPMHYNHHHSNGVMMDMDRLQQHQYQPQYNQYPSSMQYNGGLGPPNNVSGGYSNSHNIHMPTPNFPYPPQTAMTYGNGNNTNNISSYNQSNGGYLSQRMDIGYGGNY